MTVHFLPTARTLQGPEPHPGEGTVPADPLFGAVPEQREPWQGEAERLAEAAAAGRRAAQWIRSLPLSGEAWICGPLADAVEEAMTSLDPADCDDIDRYGHAGVPEPARHQLEALIFRIADTAPLTARQQAALLAVVHCVQGLARLLANDPGTTIEDGELTAVCAAITNAIGSADPQDA